MTTGQHRADLPDFLLDRALGGIAMPALLRAAGLRVHPLVEIYPPDAQVGDAEWLGYARDRGWPVLLRDSRIRYRPVQLAAVAAHGLTAFCLAGKDLGPAVLAEHLLAVLGEIALACARPGPALHLISAAGMRAVPLD
jgi:PIN like domain